MSIESHRRHIIAAAAWSPDAKEFQQGILDQVCNVIPVYTTYRTLQRIHRHSTCPGADNERRTTGTYVHRLSVDQSLDLMQPDYSEPNPAFAPKLGFQSVPAFLEYFEALRGLVADTSTTILLVGQGAAVELFGTFEMPHANAWDAINDLVISFVYRINAGFSGTYDFTVEIGTVSPINSTDPNDFTPLTGGSFNMAGDLATDAGDYTTQQISILNADLPANPQNVRYGWKITHDTPLVSATDELFNPTDAHASGLGNTVAGWKTQAGSADPDNIVDAIEGAVGGVYAPDNADYAESAIVWSTQSNSQVLSFRCGLPSFVNLQNHKISFRYSTLNVAQKIILRMYQGIPGSPGSFVIQQWGDGVATIGNSLGDHAAIEDFNITDVNPALIDDVQNWSDVWFAIFALPPASSVTVNKTYKPDYSAGRFNSASNMGFYDGAVIGLTGDFNLHDDDDTTGLISIANPSPDPGLAGNVWAQSISTMEPSNAPKESVSAVRVSARILAVDGPIRVSFSIEDGNTGQTWNSIAQGLTYTQVPASGFLERTWDVSMPNIALFFNWQNIRVRVRIMWDSVGTMKVSEVRLRLTTGVDSNVRIYGFSYIGPGQGDEVVGAPIDISYMRADGPALVAAAAGDKLRAYIGTVEDPQSATQVGKIYEIDSPDFLTWTDVSDPGAPYDSNERDKSWHFAGYGEMVVATNYSNVVQRKGLNDTNFSPLIGFDTAGVAIPNYATTLQGVYPRGRFVATINAFLCLANCDPLSVPGVAQPYTFWCSRYSQPQYFATQKLEWQSAAFQLVSTAGELTGLVGGEYGVAFKENSIMRVEYVQLPEVFDFPFITRQQGTLFPRSIVAVDDDIYFIGIGGIYRIRSGQMVEPLLEGIHVKKFMFDSRFEEFAITSLISSLESENSARVIGGYEAITGCVFWAIHTMANGEDWFMCDAVIVFSPTEGKFSLLRGDAATPTGEVEEGHLPRIMTFFPDNNIRIGGFLSLGNRAVSAETHTLKTIMLVEDIPPNISTWSGTFTYEFFMRSNTVPSSQFPGVRQGQEIILHGVRPLYVTERRKMVPPFAVYIEANQSHLIDDGHGEQRVIPHTDAREDGRIDIDPLSGEFFKFGILFGESDGPLVKEFHGWQVWYEPAGDH